MKTRLIELDVAKGLAIALVVIGHIPMEIPPQGNDWYLWLHHLIYKFHMPFFMFLSGFIMYYGYEPLSSSRAYLHYVTKKSKRLLPGFFIFAVLIYIGKLYLSPYLYVDDAPEKLGELVNILVMPKMSPAGSLWYIYVLFEFYLFFPLLLMLVRGNLLLIILVGLVLHFVPVTSYFSLDLVFEYALYFSIGVVACRYYSGFRFVVLKNKVFFILLFIGSFFSVPVLDASHSKTLIGLLSIPAIYAIVNFEVIKHSRLLTVFGEYSYPIYLMNTITIGFAKAITLEFLPWGGVSFMLTAPLLWYVGLYGPIYIKKYLLARIRILNAVTS